MEGRKVSRSSQEVQGDDRILICFVVPSSSEGHLIVMVPPISQNYIPQSSKTWEASETHTHRHLRYALFLDFSTFIPYMDGL